MSSIITPKPEPNSARNRQARITQRGPSASGTSRSGAGKTTQPSAKAGPTPIRRVTRPVTTAPRMPPTAAAPSTSPRVAGETPSIGRRVEDEERGEDEIEEVDRRGRAECGPDDRAAEDPAHARDDMALPRRLGRRLLDVDGPEEEGGGDIGARVDDERYRRRDRLHEHAADARAGDVGQSSAAVHDRAALDEALARHERDVERAVGDVEERRSSSPSGTRRRACAGT